MDDLWHLRATQDLNINYSQSNPASASVNQIEMLSGPFGHPYVQQEVCVIERTIRQEPVGANLLNFGLPGPHMKSVRGDFGNSLLALVPGSQHQVRSSYQSLVTPQSPHLSSNPQAYQMGSASSPGVGSWPGHLPNISAGTRLSGGSSGLGLDSSMNMHGRDVNLSMLGRETNLTQYLRMTGEQDCLVSNLTRTSGNEVSKHTDNASDISGQSPYPQWLTEIISSRQRGQIPQSPSFPSGATFPRVAESSRDGSTGMSTLSPLAPAFMREARVVCINYETGQKVAVPTPEGSEVISRIEITEDGGELYITQLGLLGVVCSCHGFQMSVAKFTQHVGINSSNPGNVVTMDGTGESLVQWRKTLFSLYGIKVPYDNQGWNWSEGAVSESGSTKYKAVVTQSWQKEVDVSYSGEPLVKSRLTQGWDASLSPSHAANYPLAPNPAPSGLSPSLGEGGLRNSRETFLKSLERSFRSSSLEFGSCPSNVDDMSENVGRCPGLPEMHPCRNSSTEFINFISGSQQLMAGQAEQQVAVERQIAVGRSLFKGLDLTWSESRESLQLEKDNSLSSFELKLGQPSQQCQSAGPPASTSANQMQRGGQQHMQNPSATSSAGLQSYSGREESSTNRLFNQSSFQNTTFMEPNHHSTFRVDPNRGMEGNGSVLVDHSSFKDTEDVSTFRFVENLRERENILTRDGDQFPTGVRRWPNVGCVRSSFKSTDTPGMNSEHPAKRWAEEAQLQICGVVRPVTQGHQELDSVLSQEWMSKNRPTEDQAIESSDTTMAGRGGPACCGENTIHIQRNCSSPCREGCGDKERVAYGDMITSRGARDGQVCAYVNNTKATPTIMEARILSKFGEDEYVCMREANQEGNHTEPNRHTVNRAASQGLDVHDCSSPRGRRFRSHQAAITQGYSSCANSIKEHSNNQGCKASSVGGGAHLPISAAEADGGPDKRFLHQEGSGEKPCSRESNHRESNHETFQWKEMGGIFVSGNDTIPDVAQDDVLSPRSLAEDLLANTGANVDAVAVSSKVSDKQPPVSDVCSKSSENVMSDLSDGIGAEEEVSNGHCDEKNPLASAVVDEASGIGKCSSSDGVDMGLMPNLNMSSKDEHTPKDASPSSQGYPNICAAKGVSRKKIKTTSRGGGTVKGPVARFMGEDVLVKTAKETKRRRMTKWKSLDSAVGATDSKRHKPSPSVNVAENFDSFQKLKKGSDVSNCLGNKNLVGFSPSHCGKDIVTKAFKMKVSQGNRVASNTEQGMELNSGNRTDSPHIEERNLTTTEALVIRVPQSLNRKTAKRSGRPKPSKIKLTVAAQDDSRCNKSALSEMVTRDPASVENSIIKEPAGSVGEMADMVNNSLPTHLSTPKAQSKKTGRVLLRRPSPRYATRMVSLNDIMNKPEVVPVTARRPSVAKDVLNLSALQEGSSSKEDPKACASKNSMKVCATKSGSEAITFVDSERTLTEGRKRSGLKEGEMSAMEGLKVKLCSSKNDVSSPNRGLQANTGRGGLKVSFAKQGSKISSLTNGLQAVSGNGGSKKSTCEASLTTGGPKRVLKASGPVASLVKDNLKESYSKSTVRIPVAIDSYDVEALRACSKAAATKNRPKDPVAKISMHLPASKNLSKASVSKTCSESVGAEDFLKPSSHKDVRVASGRKGLKATTLKERLKTLASRDASQGTFSFDIGILSVPKDVPDASELKDGSKSVVPLECPEAPFRAQTHGKALRKPDSSLAVAAVSHGGQDKVFTQVFNSLKESKHTTRIQKQELRKVRSLYELISDKSVSVPGTGVFEFYDEEMESSGIPKQDSVRRPSVQSDATFSVPIHFTDTKMLVPRGERSSRGRPAEAKNLFLQRHIAGSVSGRKLGAEPVEIVVGRKLVQDIRRNVGTPLVIEKERVTDPRLCTVAPLKWSLQKSKNKCEIDGVTTSSAQVASCPSKTEELVCERTLDKNRDQSHKRAADSEIIESPMKRQKFSEPSKTSQLSSGVLKVRHPLPISIHTAPATPSVDVVSSNVKGCKKRSLSAEDHLDIPDIPAIKKRCQRQKRIDCQVPEGVVECCVCGSSISEFLNQILCCSACPVKVHQACYGVKKIPNSAWFCRTCKATATQPICVLCGYGGGAMTRAQKSKAFQKRLVKVWQEKINPKEMSDICLPHSEFFLKVGVRDDQSCADRQYLVETSDFSSCSAKGRPSELNSDYPGSVERHEKPVAKENLMPCNTVSSGLLDLTVVQWVHMVCALWMPGTRCLNNSTMGVFDVSGVTQSRRKMVCSVCNRKGGACMQCRVIKCGVPFHPWCGREKGLLRSEIVEDGSNSLEFNGKCLRHGEGGDLMNVNPDVTNNSPEDIGVRSGTSSSCARTEGYAGKLTLEERALRRRQATRNGSAAVSPEQVAAWLRINERKTCKARRFLKSVNSDQKTDHREYLRFKQEQGWRRLSVYKSGIHALGLYTSEFIGRGEMVVEYIGEIVGLRVADKREADYHSGKRMQYQGACYLFRIDRERIIDATRKGGIARFVNHSCSPNCVAKVICVKNQSKVVFFAQRDIYAGEEITYDYQFNFEQEGDKIPCFCGSATCRGTLN